jgi:hypothetical protein
MPNHILGVQELGSWTKELGNLVVYMLLSDIYYAILPNSSTAFQAPFSSQNSTHPEYESKRQGI